MLNKIKIEHESIFPEVILVDGNGYLHPRGFGLACHLGVLAGIPTIGVGKNLLVLDGLTRKSVRAKFNVQCKVAANRTMLIGDSGKVWGAALKPAVNVTNPIYISIGHKLCLESCIAIVLKCCKYRIPEPVRQADLLSREFLRRLNNKD